MRKDLLSVLVVVALGVAGSACTADSANVNSNANASPVVATNTTQPAPDNSEITTTVDNNGVKTETRVFHDNPRISRVVVTTRDGKRTTTVYGPSGESKDVGDHIGDGLSATGNALADAAGFVADKSKDVGHETKEGAATVADKTTDTAKKVGDKTADTARTVGAKTESGAKTVRDKTVEGAKKTGKAIKKIVP
ncbi:MAG TPA: hypothetical protein VLL54_13090 [Pyrinomonadaceae bacterium]|nr:hypothetical protein [Pyrinomonadaceae bacterium]